MPDDKILIRLTRTGKDSFEEVYPATLAEWTRLTGLTQDETNLAVDCDDLADEEFLEEIMSRDEVDVKLSELESIPYVINMF